MIFVLYLLETDHWQMVTVHLACEKRHLKQALVDRSPRRRMQIGLGPEAVLTGSRARRNPLVYRVCETFAILTRFGLVAIQIQR